MKFYCTAGRGTGTFVAAELMQTFGPNTKVISTDGKSYFTVNESQLDCNIWDKLMSLKTVERIFVQVLHENYQKSDRRGLLTLLHTRLNDRSIWEECISTLNLVMATRLPTPQGINTVEKATDRLSAENNNSGDISSNKISAASNKTGDTSSNRLSADNNKTCNTSSNRLSADNNNTCTCNTSSNRLSADNKNTCNTSSNRLSADNKSTCNTSSNRLSACNNNTCNTSSNRISADNNNAVDRTGKRISAVNSTTADCYDNQLSVIQSYPTDCCSAAKRRKLDDDSSCKVTLDDVSTCKVTLDDVSTCKVTLDDVSTCKGTLDDDSSCKVTLDDDSSCKVTLDDDSSCKVTLDDDSSCKVTLDDVSTCKGTLDDDSSCKVTLDDVSTCKVTLDDHSSCKVTLDGVSTLDDDSSCKVTLDDDSSCKVTLDDDSSCKVTLDDNSTCNVTLDDDSSCKVTLDDDSTCKVTLDDDSTCKVTLDDDSSCKVTLDDDSTCKLTLDDVSSCKVTFRVSCRVTGFPRKQLNIKKTSQQMGVLISKLLGWKIDLHNPKYEINIYLSNDTLTVGIPLISSPLSKRSYIRHCGLRTPVAWILASQLDIRPGDVVLDPMCGTGTILLEASCMCQNAVYIGMDKDMTQLNLFTENITYKWNCYITPIHGDTRQIPLPDNFVDKVVTDAPFGQNHTVSGDLHMFYNQFFKEVVRVVKPGGRIVVLTSTCLAPFLQQICGKDVSLIHHNKGSAALPNKYDTETVEQDLSDTLTQTTPCVLSAGSTSHLMIEQSGGAGKQLDLTPYMNVDDLCLTLKASYNVKLGETEGCIFVMQKSEN